MRPDVYPTTGQQVTTSENLTKGSLGFPEPERRRRRDPARVQLLRRVIRYMLDRGGLAKGDQVLLAMHFKLSRQRVHQLVRLEREARRQPGGENGDGPDTEVIGEAES